MLLMMSNAFSIMLPFILISLPSDNSVTEHVERCGGKDDIMLSDPKVYPVHPTMLFPMHAG